MRIQGSTTQCMPFLVTKLRTWELNKCKVTIFGNRVVTTTMLPRIMTMCPL